MIVVTGAAGFIGSNIVEALNAEGRRDIAAVDVLTPPPGEPPLPNDPGHLDELEVAEAVDRDATADFLARAAGGVEAVIHMGACSDTTQTDREFMMRNNCLYSQQLWRWCADAGVPLIYASSAATYGDGSDGYDDRVDPAVFRPLNLYGESKQRFDLWALEQADAPPRWAGLKFFNVYGPREAHKGRMASVAHHAYRQIRESGRVKLFRSHREGVPHGGQKRDFIYVADAVAAALHLLRTPPAETAPNGLYNVGAGTARTFEDLGRAVFAALGRTPEIEYIPMPEDLRGRYQYFTEARTEKLRASGFDRPFHTLEEGVDAYVRWLTARDGADV